MDIKKIQRQIEYCKGKTDRLHALFKLPKHLILMNYSHSDIDGIIKTLEEIKQTISGD
jgi:hypothetical protein